MVSELVFREIDRAPERVQQLLSDVMGAQSNFINKIDEVNELKRAYIDSNILNPIHENDAEHIAYARSLAWMH